MNQEPEFPRDNAPGRRAIRFKAEEPVRRALATHELGAALDALMDLYGDMIYWWCYRRLRNEDAASDALQETFTRAFHGLRQFRGDSLLSTWLVTIARNVCCDIAEPRPGDRVDTPPETPEGSPGPHDIAVSEERRRLLAECLNKLTFNQRSSVRAHYLDEMSFVDMEAKFGVARATLQARVARALIRLRRCLAAKGVTP
jgi:RNA polymerase sigma-70 factor, ECF subfamily